VFRQDEKIVTVGATSLLHSVSLKGLALGGCYIGSMPRKSKPLPLPLVDPASHPPPGFRAMLIRRVKLKYPELSESQIARYVGCSPSNVHQVLKSFLACRPIRDRIFRV
jgi:hypothetical protein